MDLLVQSAKDRISVLESELRNWVSQYGCDCGHPHCSICRDTQYAKEILSDTKVNFETK